MSNSSHDTGLAGLLMFDFPASELWEKFPFFIIKWELEREKEKEKQVSKYSIKIFTIIASKITNGKALSLFN